MKKVINFRFLFFLSVLLGALILGICEIVRRNYFWSAASFAVVCAAFILIVFCDNNRPYLIIALVLSLICAVSTLYTFFFWKGEDKKGQIIFTLTDQIIEEQNQLTVLGKDIKVNGQKIKGKVLAYITLDEQSYLYNLRAGDKLLIYEGELISLDLIASGGVEHYNYHENIKYILKCAEFDVRRYGGRPDVLSGIRYKIKEITFNIPDKDASSIAYAMITGNRDYISGDIYNSYKTAGLAHVLAVSGLNISFLILCLNAALSRIKGHRFLKLIILSLFIAFYCALCGFAPSVLRAGIMGIIMIFCKTFGYRPDSLNSLGFAGILMLIFRPLYIYNLSFLLSFASMFCIICLYSPLVKLFNKILKSKIGAKISQLLAMTLSANIGVYPLMAHFFNSFSVYSLVSNLVLLPLINIVFIALFAACLISIILPFTAFLVIPIGWGLKIINTLTRLISGLPYSEFIIFSLGAFSALYYLIAFVLGGHVNLGKKFKALAYLALTVCLAMSAVFSNIPVTYAQDFFTAYAIPVGSAGLAVQDNSKYLIGEVNQYNYSKIKKELIKQKIRKIDYIIITSSPRHPQAVISLAKDFRPDKIAIVTDDWALCDEIEVQSKIDVIQIFDKINYIISGLEVFSYSYNNIRLGTSVLVGGKKFLYPLVFDEDNLEILNVLSGGCDILVCDKRIKGIDFYMFLVFDCEDTDLNIIKLSESDNYTFLL